MVFSLYHFNNFKKSYFVVFQIVVFFQFLEFTLKKILFMTIPHGS